MAAASALFRPSPDASVKDVRVAGIIGIAFGVALAGVALLVVGLIPLGPRTILVRAFLPILLFAQALIVLGCYRALFGLDSNTGRAGWRRVLLVIGFSLGVVALMSFAAIGLAQWLNL